ncbi:chitooligosaccharide deacetylase [Virgibacillus phasianinus]|uniref:Chitooligosaccharide deacetylase n=1 Tax=Virgibacillus phasianinus TaxID=2017483 RepID=A0A220U2Z6_9BACI|nr:carbohydrate deacetylase [Virgibacillus phasianinus]ASK62405.1 chitooligosaccharide deacetylase [Virgibacillus phasianinus]
MNVLFNADDFGLTKGVTDGIMQAHLNGVVGSTTLMMNGWAVDYAVEKAKEFPSLRVGIHLVLTWGRPICSDIPELVDTEGLFKYKNTFMEMDPPDVSAVEKEWRAQIEAFLKTGLPLHHIDSHHHIHGWAPLKDVVIKLAKEFGVRVRYVDSLKAYPDILLTEKLWLDFYESGVNAGILDELYKLDVQSVEVMTHPAVVDDDLQKVSTYLEERAQELKILCSLERHGGTGPASHL